MTGTAQADSGGISYGELIRAALARCLEMDASVNEKLAMLATTVRAADPTFAEAIDRLVERLQASGAGASAPKVGDIMPSFMLPDDGGHLVMLDDLLASGPVAVIFHRGHWCPYCRINSHTLAQASEAVAGDGGQIVAIVPDTQRYATQFRANAEAPFPILSDIDNGYAASLNLAFWVGDEMKAMMAARGRDLPLYQGSDAWMVPIPATFVVGADGRITARFVDPDYRKRMDIEDMVAAIRSAAQRSAR